jgi:hypothetical protein
VNFARFFRMMGRMQVMPVSSVGMMRRLVMVAGRVMFSGLSMVMRSFFVMLGGFVVMFGTFLARRENRD